MIEEKNAKPVKADALKIETPVAAAPVAPVTVDAGPTEIQPEGVVAQAMTAGPDSEEHADIGEWEATEWKGVPMWRHKRTGETLFKRNDVWRQRNKK